MDGLLVIDKPSGPTSHDICQFFKREMGLKKVGHAGTLDPLATGVLILLLDGATRLQSIFLGKDKEYQFTMKLGVATDTYDSEGKIISECAVPEDALERLFPLLTKFRGEILQRPPAFSAIKKNGQPLYKLARQGKPVLADPRKVTIYFLEMVDAVLPDITLKCRCSSGTYVRSLAHDIGKELGCGAHITTLRRLRSEPFGLENAIKLSSDF